MKATEYVSFVLEINQMAHKSIKEQHRKYQKWYNTIITSLWDSIGCCQLTPVLLFMSSPTGTHYINLTTSCLPCMSDIIAHTNISTRTSRSNVKANKLDVNDTQYDGTCKGSSSEDLQKDVESSSPHKVLALTWPVIWVQHAYNVLECIYSVAMPCAQHADHACKYVMPSCFSVPIPFMITCFQIQVLSFYSIAMPSA